ncbi:unnamed protein product [Leptosia nina]|uniref:Uncharacterized protein n=1 Tax=Leptosia nina TaxID=320188 RepID=A0AAV1ISL4_9NEOP
MDEFDKCCRLCAKPQEASLLIFGAETASMKIKSKLRKYLLISVEANDRLPKSICAQCCRKLCDVCDFIDRSREAQITLMKHSLFNDQLKGIEESKQSRIPQITNITFQGANNTIQTAVAASEVTTDFAEITCLNKTNDYVTLTPNFSDGLTDTTQPEEKPFACKECNRKFLTEFALKNHSWLHSTQDKPPYCASCDKVFAYKNDFLEHFKEFKHARYCNLCKRTSDKNLKLHMERHNSNKQLFTCEVCGLSYPTRSRYKNHMVTHSSERPFECNVCLKRFKRRQELRFHLNKHTGDKPYKCPKCDRRFTTSGNFYSHRMRMHPKTEHDTEDRPEKESARPEGTIISKKNNNQTKYHCSKCSHSFKKKENYTYHMYKHTGIKPYQCQSCDEKYVTRRGILIHYEKKHPGKERPLALLSKNSLLNSYNPNNP